MKLSVSVSENEVAFIDRYASEHAVESRSGVIQRAISLLRATELGGDYAAAWDEWAGPEAEAWEHTIADGLSRPTG